MTAKKKTTSRPSRQGVGGGQAAQRVQKIKDAHKEERRKDISFGKTLSALDKQHEQLSEIKQGAVNDRQDLQKFNRDLDAFVERLGKQKRNLTPDDKDNILEGISKLTRHRNYSSALTLGFNNLEVRTLEAQSRIKMKLLDKLLGNALPTAPDGTDNPLTKLAQSLAGMFAQDQINDDE